ncbi:MAG: hypothetical protein J5U16_04480 [Candidatus Methanoperedens sp.]|nr:hypothetical protein [Candidatus Methanoperedens sp.]
MIDMKQKIKENQRKQRTVVDAFHKKIREEALPNLREKKIAHIRRVDELQDKIHKKWISKKDSARERLKASKEKHRSNVGVLGDAIKEQQRKQREKAQEQIDKAKSVFKNIVQKNRKIIENRKMTRRMREKRKGKLLFACPTMPSRDLADHLSYSPSYSSVPDPEYAGILTHCFKGRTVPDQKFADSLAYSPKHPEASKPELAEATMLSCKLSLVKVLRKEP